MAMSYLQNRDADVRCGIAMCSLYLSQACCEWQEGSMTACQVPDAEQKECIFCNEGPPLARADCSSRKSIAGMGLIGQGRYIHNVSDIGAQDMTNWPIRPGQRRSQQIGASQQQG